MVELAMAAGPAATGREQTPVLEFQDVHKRYPGVEALRGVSLTLPRGVIVGLLGANGSGKSTLIKLAAGLLRPNQGHVRVLGMEPGRRTKARVAYLPEVDHLYPWMTVAETLNFVRRFYKDWQAERERLLLNELGLPERQRVGALSKGMRARLRLVLALSRAAELILLDEPLAGIDPPSRAKIVRAILGAYRAGEQTLLVSTHEVLETESLFDRVLVIARGQVLLDGDADQLRSDSGRSIQGLLEEVLG
ncbi:MAG TPA: ABC transporter ATP-binding protein [Bacillota bacterium]